MPVPWPTPPILPGWLRRLAPRVCVAAVTAFAAGTASAAPPHFWDDWTDLSDLANRAPDSARVVVGARLARDPHDLHALMLQGGTWAADSSASAEFLAADTLDLADNVRLGVALAGPGMPPQASAAWRRACAAYLAAGRVQDAARAAFHAALGDRSARDPDDPALAMAETLAVRAGDDGVRLAVRTIAGTRWLQRDVRRALAVLQQAVRLTPATGPCELGAEAERQLGLACKTLGRLDSARVHYERAVGIADALGRPELSARCLHSLGTTREAQGRLPEAGRDYRRALAMVPAGEARLRANIVGQLGKLHLRLRQYDEAERCFLESKSIYDAAWPRAEGRILNLQHLAEIATLRGAYDSARAGLERALTDARRFGLARLEGALLSDIAALDLGSGDAEAAAARLEEAIAHERRLGRERYVGDLLCTSAEIHLRAGRPAAALRQAREAAARLAAAEPALVPRAQSLTVRALVASGRLREAAAIADSARTFAAAQGDTALEVQARTLGAVVDLAGGHAARARDTLAVALTAARRLGARDLLLAVLEPFADALLQSSRPAAAVAAYEEAIELQESARLSLGSREERSRAQGEWQDLYVQLARAHLRAGRPAEGFRVVDRSRARGLRETLAEDLPAPRRGVPTAVARAEADSRAALEHAQRRLIAEASLAPAGRSEALTALARRCQELRTRHDAAQVRLERAAPAYARDAGWSRSLGVRDVQRRLRPGEGLLAYLVGSRSAVVFLVSPTGFVAHEIAIREAELAREVDSLRATVAGGDGEAWRDAARRLGHRILPAAVALDRGTLHVSADGPLHAVPFEMLMPPGARDRLVVDQRPVVLGASPTLLFGGGRSPRAPRRSLAAFGDPLAAAPPGERRAAAAPELAVTALPHARREVEGIVRVFPGARAYLGAEATECHVLRELERASVMHVAAHGFVDPRHPRHSGLVLARDRAGGDDGLLQAWEVAERRGALELVTLSACESGRGQVRRGEGLLGLARAFRIAGARQLLASLWPVDDAVTADFMIHFYTRLARGETAPRALAATKRAMRAGTIGAAAAGHPRGVARTAASPHRHPAAWAAFVLHGEAEPRAGVGSAPAAGQRVSTTRAWRDSPALASRTK